MRPASKLNSNAFTIILIQFAFLALILVAKQGLDNKDVDTETVQVVCSYCLTLNIAWTALAWHFLGASLFSPFILFMASVSVFNTGQVVLDVLGLDRNGLLGRQFPPELLAQTMIFVLFAISALNLGGFISAISRGSRARTTPIQISDRALRQVATLLFLIALVPSLLEAKRAIDLVMAGGYMALYQTSSAMGAGAAYTTVLMGFLVPSAFLLLAGSRSRRLTRIIACSIIGAYILLQFFLGYRGGAIAVLATSLWLWHVTIVPVPKKLLLIAGVVATFVLPLIAVLRVLPAGQRSSLSVWKSAYAEIDNPAVALVREMGGSMGTTAHTIELVPDVREFDHGASYVYALSTLFPNLFWEVHPGVLNSPSRWLVSAVSPEVALAGGGLGYSLIAEGYLNFAFVGAVFPMLLLGWGVGTLSWWSETGASPLVLCFIALAMIPLLVYARAEAGDVVRGIGWYGGIPYILVKHWPQSRLSTTPQVAEKLTEDARGS